MKQKIGAIDPEIKAEIDKLHDYLDRRLNEMFELGLSPSGFYWTINDLAKRI